MSNDTNQTLTSDLSKTLLKLANFSYQFDPDSGTDLSADLQQHLILHTFATIENEWNTVESIQRSLENIFDLKFENIEVIDTIRKLRKSGKIEQSKDNPELYRIHFLEKIKINDSAELKKDLKLRVIQEWFNQIEQHINRTLTSNEIKHLHEDIEIYIGLLAAEGGAQAIKSAFADGNENAGAVTQFENKPKWKKREDDSSYKDLRNESIQIFLKKQTDMRRRYVFELIESTFFLSLLHIDPTMASLAKSALNNKSLYLDSNIIYRLLGLQTESLQGMTKRVIEASKEFGCKLFVSQLSIDELKVSLRRAINYLEKHPPLTREYERLKLQYTGESRGFIIAFWKEYEKNGTSLSHFSNKYNNIDKILTDTFGIQITSDFIEEVSKNISTRAEISGFAKYIVERERGKPLSESVILPGELPRPEQLLIHDVRLLKIVEKARGRHCSKFAEADYWLLTADGDLIGYSQQNSKKGESKLPVAIHAKDWLLFLRQWLPRNEDYDKIFIDLVFSEKIQSYSKFPPIVIDQVVRILSSYDNITPQVAAEILADFDFTKQIQNIQKRAEQEFLEEYEEESINEIDKETIIQDIIAEKTASLINNSLTKLVDEKERERATVALEKSILKQALDKEEKHKSELQEKIANQSAEINELKEKVGLSLENMDTLYSQVGGLENQNKLLINALNITKWAIGILLGLLIIFVVSPTIQSFIFPYVDEKWGKVVSFFFLILGVTIPFGIGLGVRKTWKIITVLDVCSSLAIVIWNMID